MKWRVLRTIALLLAIATPVSARANCTSPVGVPGQMVYNADYATMQFCNGTNWISMAAAQGLIEVDPHVGTLTPNDFCTSNGGGTQVVCTTASIDLASQVSGNLGVTRLNSGTSASSSTFWRGDGAWAAPTFSLPSLASTDIWVGNGSNVATAVALSGDCTLSNAGAITCTKTNGSAFAASATTDTTSATNITSGTLGTARLGSGTANSSSFLRGDQTWASALTALPALTSTDIWVGNGSNVATAVALSGDCTLANTGAITCTKTNGTSFAASATTDATNASNITSGTVGTARLGSGTASSSTYLRGDQTWAAVSGGFTSCTVVSASHAQSGTGFSATASCAAGYTVTGGGAYGTQSDGYGGTTYRGSYSMPSGNAWTCGTDGGTTVYCYAICCH